jgi:hypothetical protein
MKPRAYFLVSPALLAQVLRVPDGTEIIGIDWDWQRSGVRIYVESDAFAENLVGDILPNRSVLITEHVRAAEPGEVIRTYESEWGES